MNQNTTISAIPIKSPFIESILDGPKRWEIRSKFTKKIGPVALIRSKSGTVVGTARISNVIAITPELAKSNAHLMGMDESNALYCVGDFAWVLDDVVKFNTPVPYKHPSGAITWVTLDSETTQRVNEEAERSKLQLNK